MSRQEPHTLDSNAVDSSFWKVTQLAKSMGVSPRSIWDEIKRDKLGETDGVHRVLRGCIRIDRSVFLARQRQRRGGEQQARQLRGFAYELLGEVIPLITRLQHFASVAQRIYDEASEEIEKNGNEPSRDE